MRGSKILVTANPKGRFTEGTITDASKPGTHVEIVPATAYAAGRPSYRTHSSGTDGAKGPRAVLLENYIQGKIYSDAYAANERCFVYWPEAGDEMNLLLKDVSGTGDAVAIGDLFGVATGSVGTGGLIKRNSSYTSTPWESNEAYAAGSLTADIWLWCTYRGDQA